MLTLNKLLLCVYFSFSHLSYWDNNRIVSISQGYCEDEMSYSSENAKHNT